MDLYNKIFKGDNPNPNQNGGEGEGGGAKVGVCATLDNFVVGGR